MKISTKGRYALRLMLDLAINHTGEYISIKSIASRQDISEKYLSQIVIELKKNHLIDTFKGVHSGYVLCRPPHEITIEEVFRIFEGEYIIDCLGDKTNCSKKTGCRSFRIWEQLNKSIADTLKGTTLADLIK